MTDNNQAAVKAFFEQWQLYQDIIANNYMFHREVTRNIQQQLRKHQLEHIDLLEVGCGDASIVKQCLCDGLSVNKYLGIDLSSQALQIARKHLQQRVGSLTLQCADMIAAAAELKMQQQSFDVILAGYVLHHFNSNTLQQIVSNSKHLLRTGGIMIVVDLMRYHNESLEHFIERSVRYN